MSADDDPIAKHLGEDIVAAHERLTAAMRARLPAMTREERERYFALLAPLVAKIEEIDKPLRRVLQEAMAELLPLVLQGMSQNR
jgi:hypothetical protein